MIETLLSLALLLGNKPQDVFEFRVDVRTVYVDVFVSHDGESVNNLTAGNFEVYDNGVLREVNLVDTASVPHTFAILLDESASISGEKRERLQEALRSFAERLNDDDELAVLSFSERTTLRKPLGFDRPEPAAYRIASGGWTGLNDALFLTLSYLRNGRGRPILVAFTDGMDNASWIREEMVLESARTAEVVVYSVRADVGTHLVQVGGVLVPGGDRCPAVRCLRSSPVSLGAEPSRPHGSTPSRPSSKKSSPRRVLVTYLRSPLVRMLQPDGMSFG